MSGGIKRVLVTGAGGFIGRHIVNALHAHDLDVIALDRAFDPDLIPQWDARVTCIESDAAALPDLDADAVIHAAAVTATPESLGMTPEAHLRANLDPALTVLEWAAQRHIRAFLFSSSAVFNDGSPQGKSETHKLTPMGTYAIAKAALEHIAATWRDEYERDVVCIRLSSIYGVGERPRESRPNVSLVARYIQQALTSGKIWVIAPNFARDWTYARDVGEALYWLLQGFYSHSLYNVASQAVLTSLQVAQAIQKLLPETEIIIHADERDAIPPIQRGYLTHTRLLNETGFDQWTPFEIGLANVIADAQRHLETAS